MFGPKNQCCLVLILMTNIQRQLNSLNKEVYTEIMAKTLVINAAMHLDLLLAIVNFY